MSDVGTLIIFGASGDLTTRLLLPGLGSLLGSSESKDTALAADLVVLGSGRSEKSREQWQKTLGDALNEGGAPKASAAALVRRADYVQGDPTKPADLTRILAAAEGVPVIYFALPPAIVVEAISALAEVDLPDGTIFAIEKPFGSDARSAAALNRRIAKLVPEHQVHRIDHFLGQPTVLGLLGMRFAGRLLEPVWNADNIERVEIVYDEQLGLEGRAGYYDSAGALIDMLQSHLLQVLSVIAMEPPASIDEDDFRAATAGVLNATRLWTGDPVLPGTDQPSRRARYTAGTIEGRSLPAYADEEGVDASRETETLAEMVVEVNTRRWAGVPFVLRSGKAIADPRRQIEITFRRPRFIPRGLTGSRAPERFVIGMHPQSFELDLAVNGDNDPFHLSRETLEAEVAPQELTQYGEVLRGVLSGDPTLSVRGDVAEQCWRIVAPVLKAWRDGDVPLESYRAGSHGPAKWR
jgi:glucose-6-phosphate 1-dehydrogenase